MKPLSLPSYSEMQPNVHCRVHKRPLNLNAYDHMVGHPRCVFINYIGLINCRTQLICGTYMFIT